MLLPATMPKSLCSGPHPVYLSLRLITDSYPLILSYKKKKKHGTLVSKQTHFPEFSEPF